MIFAYLKNTSTWVIRNNSILPDLRFLSVLLRCSEEAFSFFPLILITAKCHYLQGKKAEMHSYFFPVNTQCDAAQKINISIFPSPD